MSAPMPSRRLGQVGVALVACRLRSAQPLPIARFPAATCRSLSNPFRPEKKGKGKEIDALSNPVLDDYLAQKEREKGSTGKNGRATQPAVRDGGLPTHESSLFLPEREIPGWTKQLTSQEQKSMCRQAKQRRYHADGMRDKRLSEMVIDPAPLARRRLQRKLIIAGVKRHGRMTKAQKIMRTERQSLYSSHFLPTSVKKLQKVVNQIAGKTIPEALVQLRFSKKRVARDVIKGLEIARNEAIVGRGMGLGGRSKGSSRWSRQRESTDTKAARDLWSYKIFDEEKKASTGAKSAIRPRTIELKDGSKKAVRDPTEIYIDQSWVGRGACVKSPEFRARGQVNLLTHRTTSFSVLLKEEKTRMRLSDEIKKKRDHRKLCVALPDRPITAQRQYCLW